MIKILLCFILSIQLFANSEIAYAYFLSQSDYKKEQIKEVKSILNKFDNEEARYIKGLLYLKGKYFKKDINKAISLFNQNKNHGDSLFQLALINQNNKKTYNKLLKKAASLNQPDALYIIGVNLFKKGTKKDKKLAKKLIKKSSRYGNDEALLFLRKNLRNF